MKLRTAHKSVGAGQTESLRHALTSESAPAHVRPTFFPAES